MEVFYGAKWTNTILSFSYMPFVHSTYSSISSKQKNKIQYHEFRFQQHGMFWNYFIPTGVLQLASINIFNASIRLAAYVLDNSPETTIVKASLMTFSCVCTSLYCLAYIKRLEKTRRSPGGTRACAKRANKSVQSKMSNKMRDMHLPCWVSEVDPSSHHHQYCMFSSHHAFDCFLSD